MFVVVRAMYGLWVLGAFALIVAAVADTIFGEWPLHTRLSQFGPRVLVAIVWPLAILTPRGRYLLWARWRNPL